MYIYSEHFYLIPEILKSPQWQRFDEFKHPKIREALKTLPDVVMSSREKSTIRNYMYAYRRFEKWATPLEELSVFPSNDLAVSIYVLSLIQLGKSNSVIDQFLCATTWLHRTAGYQPPTTSNLVRTVREGARRRLATPVNQKEPITPEILNELYDSLLDKRKKLNLYNHRLATFTLLAYAGFFRFDEIAHLRREDVAFHSSYVAIFIQKAKNDVYREGHTVLIARTGSKLDPYLSLMNYCDLANIKPTDSCYLFRNVIYHKSSDTYSLHAADKPLSLYQSQRAFSYTSWGSSAEIPRCLACTASDQVGLPKLQMLGLTTACSRGMAGGAPPMRRTDM